MPTTNRYYEPTCIVAEGDPEDKISPAAWIEMHLDRDGIRHGYTVNDPEDGKTTFTLEFAAIEGTTS